MTTSTEPCPECGNTTTHLEVITDLTAPRPVIIEMYRCPDCGQTWQVIKQPATKTK